MSDDLGVLENRHRRVSLRYHALARHGYFGSRSWSILPPEWDEVDEGVYLAQIEKCGYLEATDVVLPQSEDSYAHFIRQHGDAIFDPDVENYGASGNRLGVLAAPARLQREWEEAERRRIARLAEESDRQWAAAEERARRFAEAEAREAAEFRVAAEGAWAAEPARSLLAAAGKLERTAAGDLTPVVWQTDGLYRVEGARRVLRNKNRVE